MRARSAGARIGVARQFFGQDPDTDWVMEAALDTMRRAGATLVDVSFPDWLLRARVDIYWTLRRPDFKADMVDYLATLGPGYPKSVAEMYERALTPVTRRMPRATSPTHPAGC